MKMVFSGWRRSRLDVTTATAFGVSCSGAVSARQRMPAAVGFCRSTADRVVTKRLPCPTRCCPRSAEAMSIVACPIVPEALVTMEPILPGSRERGQERVSGAGCAAWAVLRCAYPVRKENAMAVRALLHYALEVPDQSIGEKFYRHFGLVDAPSRDNAVRMRPVRLTREAVLLYPGQRKRLHHLAFGAPGDEMQAVREAVARAGIREMDPPSGAPDGGI